MSILLTTPLVHDPGHGQASETYNEIKVLWFRPWTTKNKMEIMTNYGNTVDGAWVNGKTHANCILVQNKPAESDGEEETAPAEPAYDDMVNGVVVTQADVGKLLYSVVSDDLYQYLIDEGHYAGTVH